MVIFGLLIVGFQKIAITEAGIDHNVSGWAWIGSDCTDPTGTTCVTKTNPIGWISFNSNNQEITCENISYGVKVDYSTGEISGAAFVGVGENNNYTDCNTTENTVGWLYFDSTTTPSCGSGGYPSDYCFPVKIVGGNEIQGWAPIISKNEIGNQIILTWVRFKGSIYSVKINNDGTVGSGTGATDKYAWAGHHNDGGLGWIDMSGVKFAPLNNPPTATPEAPTVTAICFYSFPTVILKWTFSDPDPGDTQSAYQIQIDNNSNFSSPEIDTGKLSFGSTEYAAPNLSWDTNYYWRIKVWDNHDTASDWAVGPSFTTPLHQPPWPDFEFSPSDPFAGEEINFTDKSICYDSAQNEYDCKNNTSNTYKWEFGDGAISYQRGDTSHTYLIIGSITVKLSVTDDVKTCTKEEPLTLRILPPWWKEIPPF